MTDDELKNMGIETTKRFVRRCMDGMPGLDDELFSAELLGMIAAAVAEEREACAKVAFHYANNEIAFGPCAQTCEGIAAAIRNRGTP